MNKKFLSIAIIALLGSSLVLTGCGNKQPEEQTSSENVGTVIPDANDNAAVVEQDTDDDNDQNTPNMISVNDLEPGKCMLTNENDGVSFANNNGEYIENTYYYYKDNSLQSIEIARIYKDKETAQKAYDKLNNDANSKEEYASIDIEDSVIYTLAKQNKVDALKSLNQNDLYNKLKSEHPEALNEENTPSDQTNTSDKNTDK